MSDQQVNALAYGMIIIGIFTGAMCILCALMEHVEALHRLADRLLKWMGVDLGKD